MRLLTLLFAVLLGAQKFNSQSAPTSTKADDAASFLQQARSLPSEFRADTILRIADSPLVADLKTKQKLVEEAYWQGESAFLPYLQNADRRSDSVDTNTVKPNGLEALTLQTRAIRQLLPLNREKAFQLFSQLPPILLPKLDCSSVFTPDVTEYYNAAAVLDNAFTAEQRSKGEEQRFLQNLISSVNSAAQVPPALDMIFHLKLRPEKRRDLLTILAQRLQQITSSDREYGGSEQLLVSSLSRNSLQSTDALIVLPALRLYIVRHLSGRRCTDNLPRNRELPSSAQQFNKLARTLDPTEVTYRPISSEESKALGEDGTYRQHLFGTSPQSQDVTESLQWLTHGNRVRDGKVVPWTAGERTTLEWSVHFDEADKLIHDLKEEQEDSPEAFFCLKADALNALAALAPPGPKRERAMEEYLRFMEDYYLSIENRNLAFTMFRHMLYTARFDKDPSDRMWILQKLSASTNPIMAFYAKLELRIGPPRPSQKN